MRQEMITPDELFSELRKQGFEDHSAVRKAHLEADGSLSVIASDHRDRPSGPDRRKGLVS